MMKMISGIPAMARIIAMVVLVAIIGGAVWTCSNRGQRAAQAGRDAVEAEAYASAAEDAVSTVVAGQDRDATIDEIVEDAIEEIEDAEGADAEINPAVRAAARRAACRLRSYRDEPECAVFQPDTP